jgi:5-methylcytosine-specific restriction endonuclease McrA
MPTAALRPCRVCNVVGCTAHKWAPSPKGNRHARGYDSQWVRLREWFLSQPENVLCRQCHAEGRTTLAIDVDHIRPFRGVADPLRLNPTNLQALCKRHHGQKHSRGGTGDV